MHISLPGRRRRTIIFAVLIGAFVVSDGFADQGDIDTTFGDLGRVLLDPYAGTNRTVTVNDLVGQPDGRLLVAATSESGTSSQAFLARLSGDGALDTTFGIGGLAQSWLPADRASDLIDATDHALVVTGSTAADLAVWRFSANGTPDTGFGEDGLAWRDVGGEDHAVAVVEQPDGKFVVAGTSQFGDNEDADIVLVRFTADGFPDDSFGNGGIARIPSIEHGTWEIAAGLITDAAGNLIVVGNRFGGSEIYGTTVIARLTPDGIPDPAFGDDGQRELSFDTEEYIYTVTYAVSLDTQDRIVIGGGIGHLWWHFLYSADAYVARLLPDASLDTSFGSSGVVRMTPGTWADIRTLFIESDGSIVAGGVEYFDEPRSLQPYDTQATGPYMRVSRILADGTLDSAFGTAGTTVVDFGHGDESPDSVAAGLIGLDDGRLVLAGHQDTTMALTRLSRANTSFAGYIGFTSSDRDVEESEGLVIISVRRSGGFSGAISVNYETLDGSAAGGHDFETQSGRLDWDDGDDSIRSIAVMLVDDEDQEVSEQFHLRLTDPAGGTLIAAGETSIVIANNDGGQAMPSPTPPPPNTTPKSSSGGGGAGWLSLLVLAALVFRSPKSTRVQRS